MSFHNAASVFFRRASSGASRDVTPPFLSSAPFSVLAAKGSLTTSTHFGLPSSSPPALPISSIKTPGYSKRPRSLCRISRDPSVKSTTTCARSFHDSNLKRNAAVAASNITSQQMTTYSRNRRSISSLSKEAATGAPDAPLSSRWWAVPPANAVHLSIGSVYVYSMWTPGMTHALGVVSASAADWTHGQVLPVFSASAVCLGLTTASLGTWVEKVGPRQAGFVGSIFWSSALVTTAAGIHFHSLEMVYAGWGLLGGIGWGLMYLSPVTTVMKWFPDRRGLATGLALSAFGAGAAIAPAFIHYFVDAFAVAPDFIGPLLSDLSSSSSSDVTSSSSVTSSSCVSLSTMSDGTQVVADDSALGVPGTPVVVATESDLAKHPFVTTGPGAYVLGTGDNGTTKAMATLGVFYGALGMLGSRFMTVPHPDWTPQPQATPTVVLQQQSSIQRDQEEANIVAGATSAREEEMVTPKVNVNDVGLPVDYVMKSTKQFPLLWISVFGNATGGLALLTSSKLMLTDIWTGIAPTVVDSSFATAYVSALGIGMATGRFGWSALSDYLGRRNTYMLFGLGIPIIGMSPALTHAAVMAAQDTSTSEAIHYLHSHLTPLIALFCGGSTLAITFYGGVFSVLPAYIADLFGQKHAGALHGKLLTAWAASAVVGPMGLAYLRNHSATLAIQDLLIKVDDPDSFQKAFGCSLDSPPTTIQTLIDAKTITIGRLMELVPAGTIDPTPYLYDSSCYAAASLMGVSFLANLMIQPLDVQKTLKEIDQSKKIP